MNNKEKILQATIQAFNQKGLKFTMDDIASIFKDKNTLFMEMVDYLFDTIKESESEIIEDNTLSTIEKIRRILGVMPESYKDIDLRQLYMLKDKFPEIYRHVEERLENGWETTIKLLEQGIEEEVIRPVNVLMFKMMMEASIEQFFQRDILIRAGMTYTQGLDEIVGILLDGVAVKESH